MNLARIAAGFVVALVIACGGSSSDHTAAPAPAKPLQTVNLVASEFSFGQTSLTLDKAGLYEFKLSNSGKFPHALAIEGNGVDKATKTLQPNQSDSIQVTLKSGTYQFYCPVDGHRQAGMAGTLKVS